MKTLKYSVLFLLVFIAGCGSHSVTQEHLTLARETCSSFGGLAVVHEVKTWHSRSGERRMLEVQATCVNNNVVHVKKTEKLK